MSSAGIQVGEIFHQRRHTNYANVTPVGSQTETVRYAVYEMAGAKQYNSIKIKGILNRKSDVRTLFNLHAGPGSLKQNCCPCSLIPSVGVWDCVCAFND